MHDEQNEGERRGYFRVDDDVYLEYRRLSVGEAEHWMEAMPDEQGEACDLILELHNLSVQAGNILGSIRKKHHDVAQYLAIQDKKIEMVARTVAGRQLQQAGRPNKQVSISASGVTFSAAEALQPGDCLELRMVLFPSRMCLRVCARVVHCGGADGDYRIGVEFEQLPEMAREVLIRHTLARQSVQLRRQRSKGREESE